MVLINNIKIKLLLAIFKLYTLILFWGNKFFDKIIENSIYYFPDKFLWSGRSKKNNNRDLVNIIMAKGVSEYDKETCDITNAIKLFFSIYWDCGACEENGGIQLYKLKQIIGKTVDLIWFCYLYNKPSLSKYSIYENIISNMNYIFIDLKKEKIYRYESSNIKIEEINEEEIIFDEIPIAPDFSW